jgi:transposase
MPGASFYEVQQATIATEALRRIAELYAIEAAIRGQAATVRQAERETKSWPLIAAMKIWLDPA